MSDAPAHAGALGATVDTTTNPVGEVSRRRLEADVAQCQRVLDELVEGQARQDAKAKAVAKIYDGKAKETEKMVAAARKAVKDAEQALKAEGN